MSRRFKLEPLMHLLLATASLSPAVSCGGEASKPEGAGGVNSENLRVCANPSAPDPTGWISCDAQRRVSHREALGSCTSTVPRSTPIAGPSGSCSDADCADLVHGHCWTPDYWVAPTCIPGCVTDADCSADKVCLCEDPVGRCIPADCSVDADCGPDAFCSTYLGPPAPACSFFVAGVACQTKADRCVGDECNCAMVGEQRECVEGIGGCGRPFLVRDVERRAKSERRADWAAQGTVPERLAELSVTVRAALTEHWTLAGLMEHASIAAFARFSLELLALGAPPDLLADATRAMADETRHAELCFALASVYAGCPVGPGPLAVSDCLNQPTLSSVVRTALLEGCIGETVAAAEAQELSRVASDPVVRDALVLIASDESRHAALAYRFVRWALAQRDPAIAPLVRETLARELQKQSLEPLAHGVQDAEESDSLALGKPTPAFRSALRREVLARVVAPCLEMLLEPSETRAAAA